jgi:hypothetical protein
MNKLTKNALCLVTGAVVLSVGYSEGARALRPQPQQGEATLKLQGELVDKFLERANQPIIMVINSCGNDPRWCGCLRCRVRNALNDTHRSSFVLADFMFGVRGDYGRRYDVSLENVEYMPEIAPLIVSSIFGADYRPDSCCVQLTSHIFKVAANSGVTPGMFRAVIEQRESLEKRNGGLCDELLRKVDETIALVSQSRLVS